MLKNLPTIFAVVAFAATQAPAQTAEGLMFTELRSAQDLSWTESNCLTVETTEIAVDCTPIAETRAATVRTNATNVRIVSFEKADNYRVVVTISEHQLPEILELQAQQEAGG